jgi:hypothetical protein
LPALFCWLFLKLGLTVCPDQPGPRPSCLCFLAKLGWQVHTTAFSHWSRQGLTNFCLGSLQPQSSWISASQVAMITGVSHNIQLFCTLYSFSVYLE